MARSKSKHIRLKMRRRTQFKQRMKRRKTAVKPEGVAAQKKSPAKKAPLPPAPPPAEPPEVPSA